jgi:hypothetical protein
LTAAAAEYAHARSPSHTTNYAMREEEGESNVLQVCNKSILKFKITNNINFVRSFF